MQVSPGLEQAPEGKLLHLALAGGSCLAPLLHQPLKSAWELEELSPAVLPFREGRHCGSLA